MSDNDGRFARNCFQPDVVKIGRCECCGKLGFRLIDKLGLIRAVTFISLADLRDIVAMATAADLERPPVNDPGAHGVRH